MAPFFSFLLRTSYFVIRTYFFTFSSSALIVFSIASTSGFGNPSHSTVPSTPTRNSERNALIP